MQEEEEETACNLIIHIDSYGYFSSYVIDLSTDSSTDLSNAKDLAAGHQTRQKVREEQFGVPHRYIQAM